jgi:hypothetical protein
MNSKKTKGKEEEEEETCVLVASLFTEALLSL